MLQCEAMAMDCAYYDHWEDPLPLCEEIATQEIHGYFLCEECHECLQLLIDLGGSLGCQ